MIPERLAEIRAALEAITPGGWPVLQRKIANDGIAALVIGVDNSPNGIVSDPLTTADAGFIALVPTYVAELLAEVDRLQKANTLLEEHAFNRVCARCGDAIADAAGG